MVLVLAQQKSVLAVLAVALVAAAFAGCIGEEDPVDASTGTVPCVGDGFVAANITAGGIAIEPAELVASLPLTLCLTNLDAEAHTLMGMPMELAEQPDWVPAPAPDPHAGHNMGGEASGGDGHAHEHGASAAPKSVFEHTIEAGQTIQIQNFSYHGLMMVHDSQWPDLMATWEILPAEAASYPVAVHQVALKGAATGDTTAGATETAKFNVAAPDLTKVKAEITWDDSEDDGTLGEAANGADTLEIRILDASGTEVAKKETTKRDAIVIIEADIERPAFPETVSAAGLTNASTALAAERPPDLSKAGEWTIEVKVVSAPGALPDSDGSTASLPEGGDGHQTWNATVTFVHEYATVGSSGSTPAAQFFEGDL